MTQNMAKLKNIYRVPNAKWPWKYNVQLYINIYILNLGQ